MKESRTKPVPEKQLVSADDRRLKKELFLVYDLLTDVAKLLEDMKKPGIRRSTRAMYAQTVEVHLGEKVKRREKHLGKAIVTAESWEERDKLYRRLAAQSYQTSQWLKLQGDLKQAAKWMSLVLRFLRLSLDPKAKQDMEKVLAELSELKNAMKENEEKQEEEGDEEPRDG